MSFFRYSQLSRFHIYEQKRLSLFLWRCLYVPYNWFNARITPALQQWNEIFCTEVINERFFIPEQWTFVNNNKPIKTFSYFKIKQIDECSFFSRILEKNIPGSSFEDYKSGYKQNKWAKFVHFYTTISYNVFTFVTKCFYVIKIISNFIKWTLYAFFIFQAFF